MERKVFFNLAMAIIVSLASFCSWGWAPELSVLTHAPAFVFDILAWTLAALALIPIDNFFTSLKKLTEYGQQ